MVLLTYVRPVEEVDRLLDEHVAWLERRYASGRLLGVWAARTANGGVILARGRDPAELDAVLCEDPFARASDARYEVVVEETR